MLNVEDSELISLFLDIFNHENKKISAFGNKLTNFRLEGNNIVMDFTPAENITQLIDSLNSMKGEYAELYYLQGLNGARQVYCFGCFPFINFYESMLSNSQVKIPFNDRVLLNLKLLTVEAFLKPILTELKGDVKAINMNNYLISNSFINQNAATQCAQKFLSILLQYNQNLKIHDICTINGNELFIKDFLNKVFMASYVKCRMLGTFLENEFKNLGNISHLLEYTTNVKIRFWQDVTHVYNNGSRCDTLAILVKQDCPDSGASTRKCNADEAKELNKFFVYHGVQNLSVFFPTSLYIGEKGFEDTYCCDKMVFGSASIKLLIRYAVKQPDGELVILSDNPSISQFILFKKEQLSLQYDKNVDSKFDFNVDSSSQVDLDESVDSGYFNSSFNSSSCEKSTQEYTQCIGNFPLINYTADALPRNCSIVSSTRNDDVNSQMNRPSSRISQSSVETPREENSIRCAIL